ncbi:MAG: Ran-binding zinc finger domain-containing protein [Sandaracinaceae bacterium]
MAGSKDELICHVCGFKNASTAERCVSCGAKLEELSGAYSAEEEARKRNQQDGFDIKWAVISFVVYVMLQGIFLVGLPAIIDAYDPQGFTALMISMAVWVSGGILVGFLSPGRTFIEPGVGALFAIIPTVWWISSFTPDAGVHYSGPGDLGFGLTMPAYVIGGMLGAMVSLFGAFLGERLQDLLSKKK